MIEEALRTVLLADATLSGLIGTRLYPVKLPQEPTLPAGVYTNVAPGRRVYTHDGDSGLRRKRIQFTWFGEDGASPAYDVARSVAAAAAAVLSGLRTTVAGEVIQGIFIEDGLDAQDPEPGRWLVTFDAIVWH